MKVIGIIGSPRGAKSRTLKLLESALKGAEECGADIEVIDVTKKDIRYCIGCASCYKTGKCVLKDEFGEVYEKLLACEGFVLGSPVYFNNVSAQLKTFMDRTADCRHCLYMQGKFGMAVVTTASSGTERTAALLEEYINMLGAYSVGNVKLCYPTIPQNLESAIQRSYEMGKDLAEAIRTKREYPEQAQELKQFVSAFKYAINAYQKDWTWEYEHYLKKGWIKGKA